MNPVWASRTRFIRRIFFPILYMIVIYFGRHSFWLCWPTLISFGLLYSFARTLWVPPPMVERFARRQKVDLSPDEVRYCRQVTLVWCGFFILNGLVAATLALGHAIRVWRFYNGFVSYLLVGTLFAAEFLYRHWRFRPDGAWLTTWMNRWIPARHPS